MPRFAALFLISIFVSLPAWLNPALADTDSSGWAEEEQSAVRLIAGRDGLGNDGVVRAGLQFRLKPGWKVYWRSPGDAGFPPQPDFKASTNAEISALSWPVPERFSVLGLETLGYENDVVLPFTIRAPDPALPADIRATVRYLTCKDICIPYDASLQLALSPGGGAPTILAHTIGQFDARVPRDSLGSRLSISSAWTEVSEKALYIAVKAHSEVPLKAPDLFVESPVSLGFGAPSIHFEGGKRDAVLRIPVSGFNGSPAQAAQEMVNVALTMTLVDSGRALEAKVSLETTKPFDPGNAATKVVPVGTYALPMILAFAFLGGLILNLMPCVLPVLSLKFLSVLKHGGSTPNVVRVSFLATACGVISAFLALAAVLTSLKSAGAVIGWGIQFQQPWFLIMMAFLVTLFACNMWGFFEFRLPSAITGGGHKAGHKAGQKEGLFGHFLQGMFATLLATPCSAPFLGTAIGFALAGDNRDIFTVFACLGLGLATPYLLIAAIPKLVTIMPKPGPWMIRLKFVLGLALAATALWLLSVLAGAAGTFEAVLTGGLLIGITLWLGLVMHRVPEIRSATPIVLVVATIAAISSAELGDMNGPLDTTTPGVSKIAWKKFDPAAINRLVDKGLLVFVDVTADWCITCQVNKRFVLEKGKILELLNSPDVIAMQADWTRPDAEIAAYLASFDRYGIPFNAVYGAGAPAGLPLSELLSEEDVMKGLREAAPESLRDHFK